VKAMKFSNAGEGFVAGVLGEKSLKSSVYIRNPRLICRRLFEQVVRLALALALLMAGNSKAAKIATTAMTTSSSINVKARFRRTLIRHDCN